MEEKTHGLAVAMEPKETADSNIFPQNIVHFENMMSYGSV